MTDDRRVEEARAARFWALAEQHRQLWEAATEYLDAAEQLDRPADVEHDSMNVRYYAARDALRAALAAADAVDDRDRLRERHARLIEDFAALLRSHTRAIWALKGENDYPEDERSGVGRWAQEVLQFARMQQQETNQ